MTTFTDTHHDSQCATLFAAWYALQTPRIQRVLDQWLFHAAAAMLYKNGHLLPETAIEMAEAMLCALFAKDKGQVEFALEWYAMRREMWAAVTGKAAG